MSQNINIEQLEIKNIKGYIKDSFKLFFRNPILSLIPILLSTIMLIMNNIFFIVFYFLILSITISFIFIYTNDNSLPIKKIKPFFIKFLSLDSVNVFIVFYTLTFIMNIILYYNTEQTIDANKNEMETLDKQNIYVIYLSSSFLLTFFVGRLLLINIFYSFFYFMIAIKYNIDYKFLSNEYFALKKEIALKIKYTSLTIILPMCIIYFICFFCLSLLSFHFFINIFIFSVILSLFSNFIYVLAKDLIGDGGIKEKKTSKVKKDLKDVLPINS